MVTARQEAALTSIETALDRIETTLFEWPVLEAIIARREAGRSEQADEARAAALAEELCHYTNEDGSGGGDVAWTAGSLLLMREITPQPVETAGTAIDAGCDWLLGQQNEPGAFGQGCDPVRHEAALCEHAVQGFFSPAGPAVDLAGTMLGTGARFQSDGSARFGLSCLALHALLACGRRDESVMAHLGILRAIVARHAPAASGLIDVAAYSVGLGAVAEAVETQADRVAVFAGLTRLAALQRGDGSWPGVDVFHMLHVLLRAGQLGHRLDAVDAAIMRAVGLISLMVNDQGRWGRDTGPERTLIGWRAFRRARDIAASND